MKIKEMRLDPNEKLWVNFHTKTDNVWVPVEMEPGLAMIVLALAFAPKMGMSKEIPEPRSPVASASGVYVHGMIMGAFHAIQSLDTSLNISGNN